MNNPSSTSLTISARHSLRELAVLVVFVTGTTLILTFANKLRLHTFDLVDKIWRVSGRNKMLMILGIISIVCFSYLILGDMLLYYGEEMSTLGRCDAAKESVSNLTGRIPLWSVCWPCLIDKTLVGYGFNTFTSPTNLEKIQCNIGWLPNSMHSGFMNALMGLGFLGVSAMVISFIMALK